MGEIKEFRIEGFSRYCLRTSDEKVFASYQLVNILTQRPRKVYKGVYLSLLGDDGKIYSPTRKQLIWKNAPYYKSIEEKIELSTKPVYGWENDYCINLDTQKIWSKRRFHFLNPYVYNYNNYLSLYVAFTENGRYFRGPLSNVVWETMYQEHIDDTKDVIMHLDWDYKNNHPRNLLKLSISDFTAIKNYRNALTDKTISISYIKRILRSINSYNIPDFKKDLLKKNIRKRIKEVMNK